MIAKDAVDGNKEDIKEEKALKSNEVYLRMTVDSPDATCHFSFSEDGKNFKPIGESFKAERDLWISAKMGIFAVSEDDVRMGGYADFDWFRISK